MPTRKKSKTRPVANTSGCDFTTWPNSSAIYTTVQNVPNVSRLKKEKRDRDYDTHPNKRLLSEDHRFLCTLYVNRAARNEV